MKKLFIVVLLIVGLLIPTVSAEIIEGQINDAVFVEIEQVPAIDNGKSNVLAFELWGIYYKPSVGTKLSSIDLKEVQLSPKTLNKYVNFPNYQTYDMTLKHGSRVVSNVTVEYFKGYFEPSTSDPSIGKSYGDVKFTFTNWDYDYLNGLTSNTALTIGNIPTDWELLNLYAPANELYPMPHGHLHQAVTVKYHPSSRLGYIEYYFEPERFINNYTITTGEHGTDINITRIFGDNVYPSKIIVSKLDGTVLYESPDYETENMNYSLPYGNLIIELQEQYGHKYRILGGSIPESPPDSNTSVNVYVKNSQTGALIANSHIDISAFVNGEFHEVVNETLPGGIYTGDLQPTGGGLPNPDYYRLIATAEGYISIMPQINFEVDGATTIYAYMEPVGGAPEDENNTFIDFYVRDLKANPIAGATVNFGGYTLYTNSAGYTIFEVEKNSTYSWTVSKLGYGSVTGNAVIGSDGRYTVNAVMAPVVTPTTTTPIPSVTPIRPTPTLTAPTGEPVSNWLEWFAAHFGMILGGGVEIGKIFMWLCFTVPVGVYVGNKAKAGAAGFMAGAGIVTLFFVLIGWVPLWLVVLLALLIGLLYAKVYSNTDNGGGR